MIVDELCLKIYQNAFALASDEGIMVAFINIVAPPSLPFGEDSLRTAFRKTVWNTPLSNTDLEIARSAELRSGEMRLDSIVEFGDEANAGCVIPFPETLRYINY
ncbi:hypothetical protein [Treponema brennaborense]|uniref:Uncharacterized protein n=1 Tax=Treponema brennaborense (strain DSM 12168 / CIP 105900 / DD5/3) TaxID=906968 RepID=F4LQC1_TREBD|nr:hypothetical protein [Treponema brennaborense]AEE16142.1 hypothetical protein Trebr_0700 [Treponema brennaborense DSM 12168]